MTWTLHWLAAAGDLTPWREAVVSEIEIARRAVASVLPPGTIDILVQRDPDGVLPETGTGGYAHRSSLFTLTLDPENPNFEHSLSAGDVHRTVAHEVHHCLRMAGPGYGWTLGEALVSEGLAGQFVHHLFGTPPEPWECAVDDATLRARAPDAAALSACGYDHAAWFFGKGGWYPRWLGYTLGSRIAGDWVAATPDLAGETWVNVTADMVLAAARGRTLPAAGSANGCTV
jgi:hypothetical protein